MDHQFANVFVRDADPVVIDQVVRLFEQQDGIAEVLAGTRRANRDMDHERAGEVILVSSPHSWQAYYWWLDDARAPDFARTVDIHRKPGYDPVELFLDPGLAFPKARIAWRLLQKKLGFRMLMDVIPLDTSLVKGAHGCRPVSRADWPVLISPEPDWLPGDVRRSTDVRGVIERALGGVQ